MFDFDSSSLNRSRWLLDGIAIVDIYAAWYMLLSINPNLPKVDPILAKIYFSEYGVNTDGLTDTAVMTMATEYDSKIRVFYRKCIVQRLVDIIERFAKICYDPRLPHRITLPVVTRPHFEGIVRSQEPAVINENDKIIHLVDGFVSSLTANQAYNVQYNRNGTLHGEADQGFQVDCEDFATYVEMIRKAVVGLYRPSGTLDEAHEDWGTKYRRVASYIKALVYMALHDVTYLNHHENWVRPQDGLKDTTAYLYGSPFLHLDNPDRIFQLATRFMMDYYDLEKLCTAVRGAVQPYGGLAMRHAVCLLHNTNAKLDLKKIPGSRDTVSFKFLCCQEYIERLDEKLRNMAASRTQPDGAQIGASDEPC